ncbi:MAG TPA: hypothetical protein VNB94_14000 [Mycobacteriales bacterium]|nr:hypothetical protein [Mycobacteriales bacterium]
MTRVWWTPSGLVGAGLFRVALGTSLVVRPAGLAKTVGVDSATASKVGWLGSMVGVRDIALGWGLVHAARRDADPRPWLLAQAASDAVDAAAFTAAVVRGQAKPTKTLAIAAFAVLGTLSELQAYQGLSRAPR